MPWLLFLLLVLIAAQAAPPDVGGLSPTVLGFIVGAVFGVITGWALWWNAGWNAHVELKRDQAVEKAEADAKKERKGWF